MPPPDETPNPEDFRLSCEVAVRFRDVDAMDHVNNAVFGTYFEVARSQYFRRLGLNTADCELIDRLPFIMLDLSIRFLSPARLDDRLRVHIRCPRLGTKSFDFDYLITADDGRMVATGRSTQVWYDYRQRRTVPVPEGVRAAVVALDDPTLG